MRSPSCRRSNQPTDSRWRCAKSRIRSDVTNLLADPGGEVLVDEAHQPADDGEPNVGERDREEQVVVVRA